MVLPQIPSTESAPAVTLPTISVIAVVPSVDEGSAVQFNISGNENLRDEIAVEYFLNPEGDFFDGLGDEVRFVRLSESVRTAHVEIATIDDIYAEQDGALTLTLLAGRAYELSDQISARVVISDLADRQQRVEEISLASQDILPDMTGGHRGTHPWYCIKSYR